MYGVVTRNAEELSWEAFDRGFYEVKDVTGRPSEPVPEGINMISCFGDNAAVEEESDLAAVDDEGNLATRERPYFDWSYVCPTRDAYREGLLETIEDCAAVNPDVRLDDVGFPREEYCHCETCEGRFTASDHEDWWEWRASVVTGFVEAATDRIPGETYFTLYPDPYPGHLYKRSGLDLDALEPLVDEFVVPLYDTAYGTTYWLESLASGFADRLDTPLGIELYAVNVDIDDLLHATEVAETYAHAVYFGYDAGTARGALRRRRAEEDDGETYGNDTVGGNG